MLKSNRTSHNTPNQAEYYHTGAIKAHQSTFLLGQALDQRNVEKAQTLLTNPHVDPNCTFFFRSSIVEADNTIKYYEVPFLHYLIAQHTLLAEINHDNISIIETLLALFLKHPKINTAQCDGLGRTPLVSAALAKNWGAIECLLQHGVEPDYTDDECNNIFFLLINNPPTSDYPRSHAAFSNLSESALSMPSRLGETLFHSAAYCRQWSWLVFWGFKFPTLLGLKNNLNYTALKLCILSYPELIIQTQDPMAQLNCLHTIKYLVENTPDLEGQDLLGAAVFISATNKSAVSFATVELLLGFNQQLLDEPAGENKLYILSLAVGLGHFKTVELLIRYGASIEKLTDSERIALLCMPIHDQPPFVFIHYYEILFEQNGLIHQKGPSASEWDRLLSLAISVGNIPVIDYLDSKGANFIPYPSNPRHYLFSAIANGGPLLVDQVLSKIHNASGIPVISLLGEYKRKSTEPAHYASILLAAIHHGKAACVRWMVYEKNLPPIPFKDVDPTMALRIAIKNAPCLDDERSLFIKWCLRHLSDECINIDTPCPSGEYAGQTPLLLALNLGEHDAVKQLLDHNSYPDTRTQSGAGLLKKLYAKNDPSIPIENKAAALVVLLSRRIFSKSAFEPTVVKKLLSVLSDTSAIQSLITTCHTSNTLINCLYLSMHGIESQKIHINQLVTDIYLQLVDEDRVDFKKTLVELVKRKQLSLDILRADLELRVAEKNTKKKFLLAPSSPSVASFLNLLKELFPTHAEPLKKKQAKVKNKPKTPQPISSSPVQDDSVVTFETEVLPLSPTQKPILIENEDDLSDIEPIPEVFFKTHTSTSLLSFSDSTPDEPSNNLGYIKEYLLEEEGPPHPYQSLAINALQRIANAGGLGLLYGGAAKSIGVDRQVIADMDFLCVNLSVEQLESVFGKLNQTQLKSKHKTYYHGTFNDIPVDVCLLDNPANTYQNTQELISYFIKKTQKRLSTESLALVLDPIKKNMLYMIGPSSSIDDLRQKIIQLTDPQHIRDVLIKNPTLWIRIHRLLSQGYSLSHEMAINIKQTAPCIDFKNQVARVLSNIKWRLMDDSLVIEFFKSMYQTGFIQSFLFQGLQTQPYLDTLVEEVVIRIKYARLTRIEHLRYEELLAATTIPMIISPVTTNDTYTILFHPLTPIMQPVEPCILYQIRRGPLSWYITQQVNDDTLHALFYQTAQTLIAQLVMRFSSSSSTNTGTIHTIEQCTMDITHLTDYLYAYRETLIKLKSLAYAPAEPSKLSTASPVFKSMFPFFQHPTGRYEEEAVMQGHTSVFLDK